MIEYLYIMFIAAFIADTSGIMDTAAQVAQKILHTKQPPRLKPFDCPLCLTWWTILIYTLCVGITIKGVALCALVAFVAGPTARIMGLFIYMIQKITGWIYERVARL